MVTVESPCLNRVVHVLISLHPTHQSSYHRSFPSWQTVPHQTTRNPQMRRHSSNFDVFLSLPPSSNLCQVALLPLGFRSVGILTSPSSKFSLAAQPLSSLPSISRTSLHLPPSPPPPYSLNHAVWLLCGILKMGPPLGQTGLRFAL